MRILHAISEKSNKNCVLMIYDALFSTKEISIDNAWKNLVEVFLELND